MRRAMEERTNERGEKGLQIITNNLYKPNMSIEKMKIAFALGIFYEKPAPLL